MTSKAYVIENVPDVDDDFLRDFLEVEFDCDVNITSLPSVPNRLLVLFQNDIDIDKGNCILAKQPLRDFYMSMALARNDLQTVIVDRRQYSHLECFLESCIEGGQSAVVQCFPLPETEKLAVCIASRKAFESILQQTAMADDVEICPFFKNFHGLIPIEGKPLSQKIESLGFLPSNPECSFKQKHDTVQSEENFITLGGDKAKTQKPSNILVKTLSQSLELDQHKWNLLQDKIKLSDYHNTSVKYDSSRQTLKFAGPDTKEIQKTIDKLVEKILETGPLTIPDSLQTTFKEKIVGSDIIKNCFQTYLDEDKVQCVIKGSDIFFYGWSIEKIEKVRNGLMDRLLYRENIENESQVKVDVIREATHQLENKYIVHISWTDSKATTITIQGVYDDVTLAKEELQDRISRYKIVHGSSEFSQDLRIYVENYSSELDSIIKNVTVSFRGMKQGQYCIEYSGYSTDVTDVHKALKELTIKTEIINVSADFDPVTSKLLTKALFQMQKQLENQNSSNSLQQKLFQFRQQNNCCIDYVFGHSPASEAVHSLPPEEASMETEGTTLDHSWFQVAPSLLLKIRAQKNIVKERADVVVCVLHESNKLKALSISQSFLKEIPRLQEEIDSMDFSSDNVQLYTPKCSKRRTFKAIAFLRIYPYRRHFSEDNLCQLILEVLKKATQSQFKTVAFPPVGLGRVLKYSPDYIAKQFCLAVKQFVDLPNQLEEIRILAWDDSLNADLCTEFSKLFPPSMDKTKTQGKTSESNLPQDFDKASSHGETIVKIVHRQKMNIKPLLKQQLESLIVNYEYPSMLHRSSLHEIVKKNSHLVVTTDYDRGSSIKMRGLFDHVEIMKVVIEGYENGQKSLHIISDQAPERGTLEFIKYASRIDELAPSYWKSPGVDSDKQKIGVCEFDVGRKVAEAIKNMFMKTWLPNKVGSGRDALNIPPQSTVEFVGVKRLENLGNFEKYSLSRKHIFGKKAMEGKLCENISQVSANNNDSMLASHLPNFMKKELYSEINECYLFHGTKPDIVGAIKHNGCDPALSSSCAMFGKGVYAAESSTKCDQYTDDPKKRLPPGSVHYAFLVRMLLGDIYVCTQHHPTVAQKDAAKLKRAPCKKCENDVCNCRDNTFYDSVMGEGSWIFREFVVYRNCHCYPEYIISYKRN